MSRRVIKATGAKKTVAQRVAALLSRLHDDLVALDQKWRQASTNERPADRGAKRSVRKVAPSKPSRRDAAPRPAKGRRG
jgi:hypothetical protein